MATRRQRRKSRRRASTLTSSKSTAELVRLARQSLTERNGRKSLDLLKRASRAADAPAELPVLLYCACACRARNLAQKGMLAESEAMHTRARQYRPTIRVAELGADDLALLVEALPPTDALPAYAEFLHAGEPVAAVERKLADILMVHRCWDGLSALRAANPFRRDAERVRTVVETMDAGDWTGAADQLRDIGRRSPFASWRIFSRAMVHFGEGDDEQLRRAINLLPDDFAMSETVEAWKALLGDRRSRASVPVLELLGLDGEERRALSRDLVRALESGHSPGKIARAISGLARVLTPERPDEAIGELLLIAGLVPSDSDVDEGVLDRVARQLLPGEQAEAALWRYRLLMQHWERRLLAPRSASECIRSLCANFPDRKDQAVLRGAALESLARTTFEVRRKYLFSSGDTGEYRHLLGHEVEDPRWVALELMEESLRADPRNREGYLFVIELVRQGAPGKGRFERLMGRMAARFPEDPVPFQELATFYYGRNAYRMAEKALQEAARRAPHDEEILDLQAIGFLKSATMSARAGRFGRARSDLSQAEAARRPLPESLLPAKRLLVDLLSRSDDAPSILACGLKPYPPLQRLRILLLLQMDLISMQLSRRFSPPVLEQVLLALDSLKPHVVDLGAEERLDLLRPLPGKYRVAFEHWNPAPHVYERFPDILQGLEGNGLLEALDRLLASGMFRAAQEVAKASLADRAASSCIRS